MDVKFNALIKNYSTLSSDIETKANELEDVYAKQPSVGAYNSVYQTCIDSLSSLIKHTETLCLETTNLLNAHEESISSLSDNIGELLLEMKLNRELGNRRVVGERTIVKQKPCTANVILPQQPYVINKVINTSLDISRYDGIGHGATHSSKVPATKTTTIKLEVPSLVQNAIFKELNELDFDVNCTSSFWRGEDDNTSSIKTPTINEPTNCRPSMTRKTSKRQTATTHRDKGSLTIKKPSTFRKRNSLTIKASAPNDISEDIYNTLLQVSPNLAIVASLDSNDGDPFGDITSGLSMEIKKYDEASSNTTAEDAGEYIISDSPKDNVSNMVCDYIVGNDNPLAFPTPTAAGIKSPAIDVQNNNVPPAPPPPPLAPEPQSSNEDFLYKARVLYAYEKALEDELNISAGDIVEVIQECDDGWFVAKRGNDVGSVPGNYLERI